MMNIRIISDIHLEYRLFGYKIAPCPRPNMAILAGDICESFNDKYIKFLRQTKRDFDHVLLVAGNHEYYNKRKYDIDTTDNYLDAICVRTGCIYLNRKVFSITVGDKNVNFLGCTLWAQIMPHERLEATFKLNDFDRIHISVDDFNALHKRDLEWLTSQIKKYDNAIVISHHAPLFEMSLARKGKSNPIGFGTNLTYLFKNNILAWISGHTHNCKIMEYNKTMCISNCLGYPKEETGFDENLYFTLD